MFEELKQLGFKVLNFESRRYNPSGSRGMPDYLIVGKRFKGDIYFVERKYKGDKFSAVQKEMAEYLMASSNYFVLTEDNEKQIIENILRRKNESRNL